MFFQKGVKTNINKKNKLVRKLKKVNKLKKNIQRKNVKIGTFNVYEWHNVQDILNFKEQCRYINSLDCDILGLQEVIIKDNTEYSLSNLKKIFNKYNIFNCTFDVYWHQDDGYKFGNLLLIKKSIKIIQSECILFKNKKETEDRSYNKITVKINDEKINIYNTHLEVEGSDSKYRLAQIKEIIKDNKNNKCILIGDLNSFSELDLEFLNRETIYNDLMKGNNKKNLNKNLIGMTKVEETLNKNNFISTTLIIEEKEPITTKYNTRSDFIYLSENLLQNFYLKNNTIDKGNFISDHKSVICDLCFLKILNEKDINEIIETYDNYSSKYLNFLRKKIKKIEDEKKYKSYKINQMLGEGWNAKVYDIKNRKNMIIKILKMSQENNGTSLLIEYLISKLLINYNIKVGKIICTHPLYIFLIKKKYEMKYFGNKITKLTEKQKNKLKELFNKSINFSKKTNIGLDLKSDNLYWDKDKKEWILIDCGPRLEYKQFGFSLDLLNKKKKEEPFQKYLKIWRQSDP